MHIPMNHRTLDSISRRIRRIFAGVLTLMVIGAVFIFLGTAAAADGNAALLISIIIAIYCFLVRFFESNDDDQSDIHAVWEYVRVGVFMFLRNFCVRSNVSYIF